MTKEEIYLHFKDFLGAITQTLMDLGFTQSLAPSLKLFAEEGEKGWEFCVMVEVPPSLRKDPEEDTLIMSSGLIFSNVKSAESCARAFNDFVEQEGRIKQGTAAKTSAPSNVISMERDKSKRVYH